MRKMRVFLFLLFALVSGDFFGQKPNVAVIVEEHSDKFDLIFYCKLGLLVVIGVLAISSFLKFQKQKDSLD